MTAKRSDHLVWFVLDTVEALDTAGLKQATRRRGGVGAAGYDPRMLLALKVYAYCHRRPGWALAGVGFRSG